MVSKVDVTILAQLLWDGKTHQEIADFFEVTRPYISKFIGQNRQDIDILISRARDEASKEFIEQKKRNREVAAQLYENILAELEDKIYDLKPELLIKAASMLVRPISIEDGMEMEIEIPKIVYKRREE